MRIVHVSYVERAQVNNLMTQYGVSFLAQYPYQDTKSYDIRSTKPQTIPSRASDGRSPVYTPYYGLPCNDCKQTQVGGSLVYLPASLNERITNKWGTRTILIDAHAVGIPQEFSYPGSWYYWWETESTHHLSVTVKNYGLWTSPKGGWSTTLVVTSWFTSPSRPDPYGWEQRMFQDLQARPDQAVYANSPNSATIPFPRFSSYDRELEQLDSVINHDSRYLNVAWGTLCARAAESIRSLDINGIAYIKDAMPIMSALGKLLVGDLSGLEKYTASALAKDLSNPRSAARRAADEYLSFHYGTRLTYLDSKDIDQALYSLEQSVDPSGLRVASILEKFSNNRVAYQRAAAAETISISSSPFLSTGGVSLTRRVNATVRSFSDNLLHEAYSINEAQDQLLSRIKRVGYEADLLPTLSNIWDLVPYSFIVDWIAPIGPALEQLETKHYASSLPVRCVSYNDIIEFQAPAPPPPDGWAVSGTISVRIYRRKCTDKLVPPSYVCPDSPVSRLPRHWVEASAIITQNL